MNQTSHEWQSSEPEELREEVEKRVAHAFEPYKGKVRFNGFGTVLEELKVCDKDDNTIWKPESGKFQKTKEFHPDLAMMEIDEFQKLNNLLKRCCQQFMEETGKKLNNWSE